MSASAHVGPDDADRYAWPGASEDVLSLAATRIARHVARTEAGVVGLLPLDGERALEQRLAPLLIRVAEALRGFVDDDVGFIDTWRTWPWGPPLDVGGAAAHRSRWIRPRVLEICPPPCDDPTAAVIALENALAARPPNVAPVLVNLGGYGERGAAPAALRFVDGVVLVAVARRTRLPTVRAAADHVATDKMLGAILVG